MGIGEVGIAERAANGRWWGKIYFCRAKAKELGNEIICVIFKKKSVCGAMNVSPFMS